MPKYVLYYKYVPKQVLLRHQLPLVFYYFRSSTGVPLGIISQKPRFRSGRALPYILCSRLDMCLDALEAQFNTEPTIKELKSFKPNCVVSKVPACECVRCCAKHKLSHYSSCSVHDYCSCCFFSMNSAKKC